MLELCFYFKCEEGSGAYDAMYVLLALRFPTNPHKTESETDGGQFSSCWQLRSPTHVQITSETDWRTSAHKTLTRILAVVTVQFAQEVAQRDRVWRHSRRQTLIRKAVVRLDLSHAFLDEHAKVARAAASRKECERKKHALTHIPRFELRDNPLELLDKAIATCELSCGTSESKIP